MSEITKYIKDNCDADDKFVEIFNTRDDKKFISFSDVKDWLGYKKKDTVLNILKNEKYGFVESTDYKIEKIKVDGVCKPINDILMTISTIKCICLLCPTKKAHQYRKYYIEMDNLQRQYVSTIIQNQLTNPILQLNQYNFDVAPYINKEVLYLIYIKDDLYKFGVTNDIQTRLAAHTRTLEYKYVVKIWDCKNRSISNKVEVNVKTYAKINKKNFKYKGQIEIIKSDDIFGIIKLFDNYVFEGIAEYEKQFVNKELEQKIKIVETMNNLAQTMLELTKQSNNSENNIMMSNLMKSFDIKEIDMNYELPKI